MNPYQSYPVVSSIQINCLLPTPQSITVQQTRPISPITDCGHSTSRQSSFTSFESTLASTSSTASTASTFMSTARTFNDNQEEEQEIEEEDLSTLSLPKSNSVLGGRI